MSELKAPLILEEAANQSQVEEWLVNMLKVCDHKPMAPFIDQALSRMAQITSRPAPERHNELREALRYKTLQEVKASPDDECLAFYNADHSVKGYLSRHQIEQAADDITQREPQ